MKVRSDTGTFAFMVLMMFAPNALMLIIVIVLLIGISKRIKERKVIPSV